MFLNPFGLLALLAVPTVIALHLFRRRFRRERVSALFLWEARTTTSLAGRRRDRLLNSKSFWSELLLALLLALAFAGPRACGQIEAKHLVVVLDGSASMTAGDLEGNSPAQQVRELVAEEIAQLPSGSRVTVILSGPIPRIFAGPGAFPQEAQDRLENYAPAAGRHDMGPATVLAQEIAGAGAVTLYTDHFRPQSYPAQVGIVALGRPQNNLAITRAARTPGRDNASTSDEVFITVVNSSVNAQVARIGLWQGDVEIANSEKPLEPGERAHFQFDLPADAPVVEARLPEDALTADNQATLAPAVRKQLGLFTDMEEAGRRQLGLQKSELSPIGGWTALIQGSLHAMEINDADLAICSETPSNQGTWCLQTVQADGELVSLVGPFLIEKRHPAVRGLLLDGVVWTATANRQLPGTPLVSAGNLVLLSEEILDARRIYHLNIHWEQSSLQRTPDWPILLANLAALRRRDLDGPRSTNLAVGESFYYHAAANAEYELIGPSGSRKIPARGALILDDLDEVGLYNLRRDGEQLTQFALHFSDDAESNLLGATTDDRGSSVDVGEQLSNSSMIVLLLALLSLCLLLADWWFLRPAANQSDIQDSTPRTTSRA